MSEPFHPPDSPQPQDDPSLEPTLVGKGISHDPTIISKGHPPGTIKHGNNRKWLRKNGIWLFPVGLAVTAGLIVVGLSQFGDGPDGKQKSGYEFPLTTCGDGVLGGQEQCENLSDCDSGLTCFACKCEPLPTCGDGVAELWEECDGSDLLHCNPDERACQDCECVGRVSTCGDGSVDFLEECEVNDVSKCQLGMLCSNTCMCVSDLSVCGDGVIGFGEQCEAGDLSACGPGQACSECQCTSHAASVCGNGLVEVGEQCDGSSEFCSPGQSCVACLCQFSVVPSPEPQPTPEELPGHVGDDGNDGDGDDGPLIIVPPPGLAVCGNGAVQGSEVCDEGGLNGQCGHCNTNCSGLVIC